MTERNDAEVLDIQAYLRMMAGFYGLKLPVIRPYENTTDTVQAMERNRMASFEIPAYFRKQAY